MSQPSWAEDPGPPLSAAVINQMIIGNIFWRTFPNGKTFGGIYNQDGSYGYGNGSGGTWRMEGNKFCFHEYGHDELCGTFHKLQETKFEFFSADGKPSFIIDVRGTSARGETP
jgi:hypothetical protein